MTLLLVWSVHPNTYKQTYKVVALLQIIQRHVMKFFLILRAGALFTSGCMANQPVTDNQPGRSVNVTWKASCNSKYSNPSNGTYIFKVKLGEVGGCGSDNVK
jgi:hypothetical protein